MYSNNSTVDIAKYFRGILYLIEIVTITVSLRVARTRLRFWHMPRLTRRLAVKSNFLIMSKPAWLIFLLIPMSSIPANGIKCENEGPCGVDRYCSKPDTNRDTCRDCEDIAKHYCHDRDSVLQKFPSCDGYCFSTYTVTIIMMLVSLWARDCMCGWVCFGSTQYLHGRRYELTQPRCSHRHF